MLFCCCRFGRRHSFCGSMVIGGISCVAILVTAAGIRVPLLRHLVWIPASLYLFLSVKGCREIIAKESMSVCFVNGDCCVLFQIRRGWSRRSRWSASCPSPCRSRWRTSTQLSSSPPSSGNYLPIHLLSWALSYCHQVTVSPCIYSAELFPTVIR